MLNDDLLRGAKAAAAYIGVSPHIVYRMAASGQIPVVKKGRSVWFRKSELDAAFRSAA